MKKLTVILILMLYGTSSTANEADNIAACMDAVSEKTGRTVDEFDAIYDGNFLTFSVVRWPNVICEVGVGKVFNLTVAGKEIIVDGWPSPENKKGFDRISNQIDDAIAILENRIRILDSRRDEAEDGLINDTITIEEADAAIFNAISRSLGIEGRLVDEDSDQAN